jgi:hypothetical protein
VINVGPAELSLIYKGAETAHSGIKAMLRAKEKNSALRNLLQHAINEARKNYQVDSWPEKNVPLYFINKIREDEGKTARSLKRRGQRFVRRLGLSSAPALDHLSTSALKTRLREIFEKCLGPNELNITVGGGSLGERRAFAQEIAQQFINALSEKKDGLGKDAQYARSLQASLRQNEQNDKTGSPLGPAAVVASTGAIATGTVLTVQLASDGLNSHEVVPVVGLWSAALTVVALLTGLLVRYHSNVDHAAIPLLVESVQDWVLNVELTKSSKPDQLQSLVADLEERLIPRVDRVDHRLAAALRRAGDLLHDQLHNRPAFQPVQRDEALRAILALTGRKLVDSSST